MHDDWPGSLATRAGDDSRRDGPLVEVAPRHDGATAWTAVRECHGFPGRHAVLGSLYLTDGFGRRFLTPSG